MASKPLKSLRLKTPVAGTPHQTALLCTTITALLMLLTFLAGFYYGKGSF